MHDDEEKEKKKEVTSEDDNSKGTDNKSRTIFLTGEIDEEKAKFVIEKLIKYERESPLEDITIYIDSFGGCLDSLLAIVDTMNIVHCDVRTICVGKAMSAAAVVLSSGAKGKRFVTPHSTVMVHQLYVGLKGSASDIETVAKEIKRMQKQLEEIVAKNTGQPIRKIREDMRKTVFLAAEAAVKYGLADEIKVRN